MDWFTWAIGVFILIQLNEWRRSFGRFAAPARRLANVSLVLLSLSLVLMLLSTLYPFGGIEPIADPLRMAIREGELQRTRTIASGVQLAMALVGCAFYGMAVIAHRRSDGGMGRSLSVPS